MSLFFANVHQCLLTQWESFVVDQSSKFRQQRGSSRLQTAPGRLL